MGLVRTTDGNMELIRITDDAGADFSHTVTFPSPVEIVRVKVEKPAAGTLVISTVTASGPTTVLGAASLGASDTTYLNTDSNLQHSVNIDSLTVVATSCGAGTSVAISSQNLLSEAGRDF